MKGSVLKDLLVALDTFNWSAVERICKRFIQQLNASATPFEEKPAKQILQALRRKRRFSLMEQVADALIRGGQSAPQVLRQYAQAMIDQGKLTAPRMVLQAIIGDAKSPATEKAEAHGLLGRILKQLYVNAHDASNPRQQKNLRDGIQEYYGVYKTSPKSFLWHGINTVALLARAKRDRVPVRGFPPAKDIALKIDAVLKRTKLLEYWDRATAVENAVALGDFKAAYDHAIYYGLDPQVDAFEVGSLLRQLTEVWQLTGDREPGKTLLPTLNAALLKREGGCVEIVSKKIKSEAKNAVTAGQRLEKVFGKDRYQPLAWMKTGLTRCEAVGRVESIMGKGIGTGFLVNATDFFPKRKKDKLLFLTNAHVIRPAGKRFSEGILPELAKVVFEASGMEYKITGHVWSSPPERLDATFVTIKALDKKAELCPLVPSPTPFDPKKKPRVYVIGYPLGGGLSISLQDSSWLDAKGRLLHYRTPTEPGSSGSPVFDQDYWTLVGLHHAGAKDMKRLKGKGKYEANEGISITAIQRATRSSAVNK